MTHLGALLLHVLLATAAPAQDAGEPAGKEPDPWVVLQPSKPSSLASAGGATFKPLFDGSILVAGANPEKDVWTLEFETELQGITGFRLEALADESLPAHGPGRAHNGNFVLNEFVVEATAKNALRFKPIQLQDASCDFIQDQRKPTQVHDGDELTASNGWAVYGAIGKDHELVVETRNDVRFDGPTLIRVELHFNWGAQHAIGRFRVSATTQPRPVRVPGYAAEDSWPKLQGRVNTAIDRGVEHLLSQQQLDGSWNHEQWTYRNGATGLATYTLAKSGVPARHPAIVRALEFMRGQPSRETYTIGCQLMALAALEDPAHKPWMEELVESLLSFQREGFAYPWGANDLSNTQYGVLGLRAAAMRGVAVPPDAFERAAEQVLEFSHDQGGGYAPLAFSYNRTTRPTSSMTVAGSAILAVADEQLQGRSKRGTFLAASKRGVEWLAQHWSVEQNQGEGHDRWNVYYLYGLERVGSVLALEKIGGHDWYREGARRLVDSQGGKGEWSSAYRDEVINTCFALLFLNRATAPGTGKSAGGRVKLHGSDDPAKPVSVRGSGDTPLTLWISSFGEHALAENEWPKDEGRGLRVTKVEYVASGGALGDAKSVLATVERDGSQPSGRERFGAQASFALPGRYTVFARVTLLAPPAPPTPDGGASTEPAPAKPIPAKPTLVMLESTPFEVNVEEALDPELLEYAKDPGRNLLAGQKVDATASTSINNDWQPAFAVDNLQCRGWAAKNDDPIPTLTLELEKPVRATACLVTPAKIGDAYGSRITRIAVTVNGRQPPLVAEVTGAASRKTIVRFPQPQVVRKLEVKVLLKDECANPEKAVGFAEIELQTGREGSAAR